MVRKVVNQAADVLAREFHRGAALQELLLRYTQALITQMTQTPACNRHKTGAIRLARGTITVLDRPALEARVCECHEIRSSPPRSARSFGAT